MLHFKNQIHVVANSAVNAGGEGLAALRYSQALASTGCAITLLSRAISGALVEEYPRNGVFEQRAVPTSKNSLFNLFVEYRFMRRLCEGKKFDLIHLHGMWSPFLAVAAVFAHRRGIPLVISPHGCLEPWALRNKYFKKRLAMNIYQGAALRSASLLVATADQELRSLRNLGFRQPIAVVPNGVDVGSVTHRGEHVGIKTFLFLSRVHPKKGLLDLVNAWALVRRPGWRIVIAGGDEEGYRAKVEALIRRKGLDTDFEFIGFVDGARKQACFDQADVFILPTYSENFGIAVAEALANELPVITTTGTPWSDLVQHRCGWWVEPGVQGISSALVEAMACEPIELKQMGHRGRQLVVDKYSWNKIGITAQEVSEWVVDQTRPKPEVVDIYAR
ncbi:glycosyltransferase [Rhodoferax antarcticus]|uniref:glycosyltransferase n=1 Tax=Rhodoferax antarcticus TaxID=81479 RepID=UPI00222567EF|nr:glycosyltransferase [Rhodoferax antarcticus]MCW2312605.1 glycosyltransferase involved in cell wall biosynthesis [Rhodoferax antarcticus]